MQAIRELRASLPGQSSTKRLKFFAKLSFKKAEKRNDKKWKTAHTEDILFL
jgi:hypothetical protein